MKSIYKLKILLLLAFLIGVKQLGYSQLSRRHYIPPVFATVIHDYQTLREYKLFISSPSDTLFEAKVFRGVEQIPFKVFKLSADQPKVVDLYVFQEVTPPQGIIKNEDDKLNQILPTEGLRIEADFPVFVSARLKSVNNGDIITSKGESALGTEFRTGHMFSTYSEESISDRSNFISVMATKNNTNVSLSDIKKGVVFYGLTAQGKNRKSLTTKDTSFLMQKNESIIFAQLAEQMEYGDENNTIGTLVKSDKPIAVNVGSILSKSPLEGDGTGYDSGLDQIVPVDKIGNKYIIIKGNGGELLEVPIVVAAYDGTTFKVNGVEYATLKAGEYKVINGSDFTSNDNMLVESNKPIYLYQTLAGSEKSMTCGLNFIPPLNGCKSANSVSISDIHYMGDETTVTVIAKTESNMILENSETNQEFKDVSIEEPNLSDEDLMWQTFKFKIPKEITSLNVIADDAISVALTNNSNALGSAGYFSGFTISPIIKAKGGNVAFYQNNKLEFELQKGLSFSEYKWYKDGKLFKTTTSPKFTAEEVGEYHVEGIDETCDRTFSSAKFTIKPIETLVVTDEIFEEEPANDIERAILDKDFDPSVLVSLSFKYNSEELEENAISLLTGIVETLKEYEDIKIIIKAYTDCRGKDEYNLALSQKRAAYVLKSMVEMGIAEGRLTAKGLGETEPISACDCDNNTCNEAQHLLNRRSEFEVVRE